jgi:hypothetical protein
VYCAEEGGRKGSLIYSVCCIHGEPLGFGRIQKEVASTKAVEYRTVSGRVVYYGRMLYNTADTAAAAAAATTTTAHRY